MSSTLKYNVLNDQLVEFINAQRSHADDNLLQELRIETAQFGDDAGMQISDAQGSFLTIITRLLGVRSALEIGTFTGHSSICIARGLPEDGKLICLDASEEWTAVAQRYWAKAGLTEKIELRIGDAIESLKLLSEHDPFDLVHIDAEKTLYDQFFESALPHVRQNGLIIFDNMLWGGRVVDQDPDERTQAVFQMNLKLANDARVETVLISIGDGIQFCRKR